MPIFESLYAAGVAVARRLTPLVASAESKIGRGVRGRQEAGPSLAGWADRARDPQRPLVWVHAPSVGEGLQARAVIESLGAATEGRCQLMFTHFSPSAEALAREMPVDWAGYLPWDVRSDVESALDAARPDLIAFTKTEVWPVLSRAATRRGIPTALVAATLPATSSRSGFFTRRVLRPSMRRLSLVAAIAEEDARRFHGLGTRREAIVVTGDPGIDSALARADASDPAAAHLRAFASDASRPILVAGSTWPADEAVLLAALASVRARRPELRLVIAPHEPTASHLDPLEERLRSDGWITRRLSEVERRGALSDEDAVVVDRVGVLAQLYTVATFAFVGGGFHGAGLHSVLEPAAAGVPMVFGPRHDNARAATELVLVGGGATARTSASLTDTLLGWLDDPAACDAAGSSARNWILLHRGAAARTATRLLEVLPGQRPPEADSSVDGAERTAM
jgi:3-deoxy-D-manno-octulosonic-acid transferase